MQSKIQNLKSKILDWWPMIESVLMPATILAAVLLAAGCAGFLVQSEIRNGKDLTPEQIDAFNKIGSNVYGCLTVAGPPPAGNTVWVVVPKGVAVNFQFGDNCHLISR